MGCSIGPTLPNHLIQVEIEEGRRGVMDMKPYLHQGVFRELRQLHYFNQVGIVFGAVTWPHEQDIAPETLNSQLQWVEENQVR